MPERVLQENEISLNAIRYRITGPVKSALSSIYPDKQVVGDFTRDSQRRASVLAISHTLGGIGVNKMRIPGHVARCWFSTCQLRHNGHLVLPALATQTAASGVSGNFTVGAIGDLGGEIYAPFGLSLRRYNTVADTWTEVATLPATATHALSFRLAGTVYLAFATQGGYTYSSGGVTWTDDTKDTRYLAYWDDRLWGIDRTGQLWFSSAIGTETDDADLPLPDDTVTSLFVGDLPDGGTALYAGTTFGLYVHDAANSTFYKTRVPGSQHPHGGRGALQWRDAIFYPSGAGTTRYGISDQQPTISLMGPDRDDGLPSSYRGSIVQLVDSINDLLAIVDATTAPGALTTFDSDGAMSAAEVISPDTGYSHILGWNGEGWEVKWLSSASQQAITAAYVSYAYNLYRLWWAQNMRVFYMTLPREIVNPNELTTFAYASSATHETPWFSADQIEVDKLALELRVELSGASANETVAVAYGLDYATSYTTLGTISANGVTTYQFPNSTTPNGTAFRSIRFRLTFARGSTNTNTPDVLSLTLNYRKKVPAKYGHQVEVDMTQSYGGRSAKQLRAALVTAVESTTLVEFTFRDDTGNTRNYYVDVVQAGGLESSGLDERGESQLLMVEP